jgi:hypothetical protein
MSRSSTRTQTNLWVAPPIYHKESFTLTKVQALCISVSIAYGNQDAKEDYSNFSMMGFDLCMHLGNYNETEAVIPYERHIIDAWAAKNEKTMKFKFEKYRLDDAVGTGEQRKRMNQAWGLFC